MAKNDRFLALEGRILTLFHNFLKITSEYAQKHHIKKSFTRQIFKSVKTQELIHSLTFIPERLYTKFQKIWLIRIGENALWADGQTDGTEIVGKILGTNTLNTDRQV